jgi:hypothetical protein
MQEVVAELDYIPITPTWSIRPVFWVHRDKPEERPQVVIHLFHVDHGFETASAKSKKRFPRREYCALQNKEDFLAGGLPIYACNRCAEEAPDFVLEEKLLAAQRYTGYDPRNNRKAAVLATKNKGTKNV